ncbi:unnamed protein product [Camellia sinensis]
MTGKAFDLFSFFIRTRIFLRGMAMAQSTNTTIEVKVRVAVDINKTWDGKMGLTCISTALSDFYSSHPHFKTRLDLHLRDSKDSVVGVAAPDLLKIEQ